MLNPDIAIATLYQTSASSRVSRVERPLENHGNHKVLEQNPHTFEKILGQVERRMRQERSGEPMTSSSPLRHLPRVQ